MSYSVKRSRCKQFFRVMRITTLLLFVFIFCMHAENSSSQNVNVTIKRSNTELENIYYCPQVERRLQSLCQHSRVKRLVV